MLGWHRLAGLVRLVTGSGVASPAVHPAARHNIDIVTGSRMKSLSTGIEASATGESLNSGDPAVHPAARHGL